MADCVRALCPCLRWRRRADYEAIGSTAHASYAPLYVPAAPAPAPAPAGGGAAIGNIHNHQQQHQGAVSPTLPGRVGLPDWVSDEAVAKCYGCAAAFDVIHRRHHCRRCRNVFCGGCSANEKPVLLAGLREPARVCMRCSSEVARENHFIDSYLTPLLEGGEMAMHRGLIMGRRTPVRLLLARSLDQLEVRDAAAAAAAAAADAAATATATAVVAPVATTSNAPPPLVRIPLDSISGVSEEGALGLVLLVEGGKQHRLECAGPAQRAQFTRAIREAAKVIPLIVGFKARVEAEREQRARQEVLAASERARREEALARRQEKQGFRDQIAQKYGLKR